MLNAIRAAKNEASIMANVEFENSNDAKISKDTQIAESSRKSKARRRLRKRNKTQNEKESENNYCAILDKVDSSSRVQESSIDEAGVPGSEKSTIETQSFNTECDVSKSTAIANKNVTTNIGASEHEPLKNSNERTLKEYSVTTRDFCERIDENRDAVATTIISEQNTCFNLLTDDNTISQMLVERESTIDETSISPDRTNESSIAKEIKRLPVDERCKADSNESDLSTNSRTETGQICTPTSKEIVGKMNFQKKSREEIKAEREAKKAAKAAAKYKIKVSKCESAKNVGGNEAGIETLRNKICEARGDVVDGEIISMIDKLAIVPMRNAKLEIAETMLEFVESKSDEKRKSELRAERRAKQETQRAAKEQAKLLEKHKSKEVDLKANLIDSSTCPTKLEGQKKVIKRIVINKNEHEVNLFKHLNHNREQAFFKRPTLNSSIHPAIVRLGVQYAEKIIVGSNARCVALLSAIRQLIQEFERPPQADFTRGLEANLKESSAYLHYCRPFAVSMHNALRHLKWQMAQLLSSTSDKEAKMKLGNAIDMYIQEQIQLAGKAISNTIQTKISNGNVILIYGCSSLIYKILCDAHDAGKEFRVVVVDGRPWNEGREQLRRLAKHGLECSYVLINALSFVMPEVSKVFLGAHAILANGAVMSRVGTAQVALMAKSFNVPVLVACETHKTCERVQTDSIVYNEIADPNALLHNKMGSPRKTVLANWRGKKSLNLLNITYDVTPAELITAVVTELAILPCTSVPVILRIKPWEI